jgi:hypothetical protein
MSSFIPNSFQVPNAFVDECLSELSSSAVVCYLFIVRKTKGWQKDEDAIAISQFVKGIGLSNRVVIKACNELVEFGLINQKTGSRNTKIFSVNMCRKVTSDEKSHVTNSHTSSDEKSHVTSDEKSHTENNSFKTTTKKQKDIYIKSGLDFSAWHALGQIDQQIVDDWLALRKTKKSPASQTVINRFAKQLTLAVQADFSVSECLEVAITRGWTGFEFEWIKNHAQPRTNNFSNQQFGKFIPDHNDTGWADEWPESPFDHSAESAGQASSELRDITDHRNISEVAGAVPVGGGIIGSEAGLDANTRGAGCDE